MNDAIKEFCREASAFVRDSPYVYNLICDLVGPTREQTDLLIEIDFLCNSFAASILTLAAEGFDYEALALRRTLLEGQTKFLYLFCHDLGFESAFWEYKYCLPHFSMEKKVTQLSKRLEKLKSDAFKDDSIGRQQISQIENELEIRCSHLRYNKKTYKWPKNMPNPLSDARKIKQRWEAQTILKKIIESQILQGFPIEDVFSISSAVHHFAAESIPHGLASHIKNGTRINFDVEGDASLIRECLLFGAYRQFAVARATRGKVPLRLERSYLEIIRKANDLGVEMPREWMGPYIIVKSEETNISVALADLTDD